MNKFYILIWIILFVFHVNASNNTYQFVVWTHSGEQIGYSLEERPIVTQEIGSIIVSTIKAKVEYSIDNVHKFTLNKIDNSSSNEVKQSVPTMKFYSNTLIFSGCIPGSEIKVMSVNGIILNSSQADKGGNVQIDISSLSSGMYLVVMSSITYKIIK